MCLLTVYIHLFLFKSHEPVLLPFYKLSRFLNKKGNNEWGPISAITFVTFINLVVIYVNIFPITRGNFNKGYKTVLIIIGIALFMANSVLFLNKNRVKAIMSRYKVESDIGRKIGSCLVILYMVLSLGLIVLI